MMVWWADAKRDGILGTGPYPNQEDHAATAQVVVSFLAPIPPDSFAIRCALQLQERQFRRVSR